MIYVFNFNVLDADFYICLPFRLRFLTGKLGKILGTQCVSFCFENTSLYGHSSYSEEMQEIYGVKSQHKQNQFIPTSEGVTACIAHPLTGTIMVGTKVCMLRTHLT